MLSSSSHLTSLLATRVSVARGVTQGGPTSHTWRLRRRPVNLPAEDTSGPEDFTPQHQLGHETLDALNGIKELKDEVRAASQRNLTEHEKTRQQKPAEGQKYDPTGEGLSRLEKQMTSMTNQLDVLRMAQQKLSSEKIEKGVADLGKAERPPQLEQGPKTFAQVASTPKTPIIPAKGPNHTLIVSSVNPQHTGDNVIERIKDALDLKATGARVDAVRKARNQKVVLRCASKTDLGLIKDQFKSSKGLKVQEPKPQNPLRRLPGTPKMGWHSEIPLFLTELFVDLTITQSEGKEEVFKILKPINEKQAIKSFAEGLRNRRLSTLISARNYTSLKDAVQAAVDEETSSPSTSGDVMY
ncbi:hypothetical protein HF086_012265 [Spodoptera exigua]|uniref:Uncharacterized protein n=1 Tax=Spodoptera exigua TaxID=7107 RepID=A0A922SF87_SPOEX|nr:hypothetical protein HF086_012265 [Spodoptera exigua]